MDFGIFDDKLKVTMFKIAYGMYNVNAIKNFEKYSLCNLTIKSLN